MGDSYGKQVRTQFADIKGTSELAMLAAPTVEEYTRLQRAVAIMTADEKENATNLDDEQVKRIALDAKIDIGMFAIFVNGYIIEGKK